MDSLTTLSVESCACVTLNLPPLFDLLAAHAARPKFEKYCDGHHLSNMSLGASKRKLYSFSNSSACSSHFCSNLCCWVSFMSLNAECTVENAWPRYSPSSSSMSSSGIPSWREIALQSAVSELQLACAEGLALHPHADPQGAESTPCWAGNSTILMVR